MKNNNSSGSKTKEQEELQNFKGYQAAENEQ